MQSPPETATARDEEERPALDALEDPETLLAGDRTRDDFLSVALQLRTPTTVSDIADRAGRGVDAAREYMRWFETIGLVRLVQDDPEQYETNASYLYWRRVDDVHTSYADSDIVERLKQVLDETAAFEDRYGAADPSAVELRSAAEARNESVAEVWSDLSRWKTLLARRNLLEDALDRSNDRYRDPSEDGAENGDVLEPA